MYKKLLYVGCAAAMVATTACSSEDLAPASEQESLVSFSVELPSELQARSRAYGDGLNATKLYYAVYDATTHTELTALRGTADFSALTATVNLRLANSRTYELVFWAQAPTAPYTIDYTNRSVTVNYSAPVKANDNVYDAFYKFETISVSGSLNQTIQLTRPFAQVNIGATDAAAATASGWTTVSSEVTIDNVYSTLNFADGTVSGARSYTYALNTKPTGEDFPVTATPAIDYQSMVYVLVANDQALVNVDFTAHSATSDINRSYANVPVQRNYRTNIYGKILTEEANFTVEIEPAFTGENNKQYVADGVELIDANTYEISNAAGLLWLEGQVNENPGSRATANTFAGKTFKLVADIDLGGARWYPIGQTGFGQFAGTFDGQGHVVKNFTITNTNSGRTYNATGLFGWVNGATIKNLTVKDATITGDHYVGAIAGYLETAGTTIENCHANGVTIVCECEQTSPGVWDNGDKVGGIVGYMATGQSVDGCSVTATSVTGYRDIGGVVGYNNGGTVKDCTVADDVTISIDNTHNYKNYTTDAQHDANRYIGEDHGTTEANVATAEAAQEALTINAANVTVNLDASVTEIALDCVAWKGKLGGAATQNLVIEGEVDAAGNPITTLTFNNTNNDWNQVGLANPNGKIILRNVKITNTGYNDGPWNRHDINFRNNKVLLENVVSDKAIALNNCDATLRKVTISDNRADPDYALWITAAGQTVVVEDCFFNMGEGSDRAIAIKDQYVTTPQLVTLTVKGTKFVSTKKGAVIVTSTAGAAITWGDGNDVAGVAALTGAAAGKPIWNDADRASAWSLLTVNGAADSALKYQENH